MFQLLIDGNLDVLGGEGLFDEDLEFSQNFVDDGVLDVSGGEGLQPAGGEEAAG